MPIKKRNLLCIRKRETLDIKLSEIPFWLTYPSVHKKKGVFGKQGLSASEKKLLRAFHWDWSGNTDEETDLGTVVDEGRTVVLMELENRVDSGGTARREIWTSQKFGVVLDIFIANEKLYQKHTEQGSEKFSLPEALLHFGIDSLEMYLGILFDTTDSPASIDADKKTAFTPPAERVSTTFLKN